MLTVKLNKLKVNPGYKVLDIGCGSGRHMASFYDMKGVLVVGSDFCFKDLKLAKERMKIHEQLIENNNGEWQLISSDINYLPFSDNYFDIVICTEVLEHIRNDKKAISEMVRVLKPDKTLVISVPRYLPEKIYWFLSYEYANSTQGHVRIYIKKYLLRLLERYGLTCYNFHYAHSLHTPFWFLKCIFGLKNTDSLLVNLYHNFLVWDIMKKPKITNFIDNLLNPIFGKSIVIYTVKNR